MSGNFFQTFMPHGMCYQWQPGILWLHVLSDVAIALSYFSISFVLYNCLRKRTGDVPFRYVVLMFCVFIFACGVTHVVSIWTVWNGQYGFQGLVKSFTAAASVATAIMLYPIFPKLMALRSPKELEAANLSLKQEIDQREILETQSHKLQSDLARLSRMTTVGQMATGLAHELNQPLLAISSSADTASEVEKHSANNPLLKECLDDIQSETQRAGEIIRALRQFVSSNTARRSTVDVNKLVSQAVRLMSGEARNANVTIDTASGNIPGALADSVQIVQVLVNLLRNAIEAIADQPGRASNSHDNISIVTEHQSGNITVSVSDTGPGLALGVDPFKAFDTSKSEGMGVGLSISREIIEAHGGSLEYQQLSSGGLVFTFDLPVVPKAHG